MLKPQNKVFEIANGNYLIASSEDPKQAIEERATPIIEALNDEILASKDSGRLFIATLGIMTGIDILGSAIMKAEGTPKPKVAVRFKRFCDDYLLKHFDDGITADHLYSLRNGITHQFLPDNRYSAKHTAKIVLCHDDSTSEIYPDGTVKINIDHLFKAYLASSNKLIIDFKTKEILQDFGKLQISKHLDLDVSSAVDTGKSI